MRSIYQRAIASITWVSVELVSLRVGENEEERPLPYDLSGLSYIESSAGGRILVCTVVFYKSKITRLRVRLLDQVASIYIHHEILDQSSPGMHAIHTPSLLSASTLEESDTRPRISQEPISWSILCFSHDTIWVEPRNNQHSESIRTINGASV